MAEKTPAAAEEPTVSDPKPDAPTENGGEGGAAEKAKTATDGAELKEPEKVPRPVRDKVLEAEAVIKAEIAGIEGKIQGLTKRMKDENDKRMGGNDGAGQARAEMKRLKAQRETLLRERQEIYANRESAKANLDAKMNERRDLRAQTKYKSVEEIDKKIMELDRLQSQTSMPLAQEKALLKEIDELKKSKKLVAAHASVGASIDDQRKTAEDFGSQIADKNAQLEVIKKQMDEHGATLAKIYDKKKDSVVPGLMKERDALRAKKKEKQDAIQALWDEFKAKNSKWKKNQDEWKVYRAARDKAYDEERARRREEMRKAREEELAKKTPYEEEMDLCDYLCNYLSQNFLTSNAKFGKEDAEGAEEAKGGDDGLGELGGTMLKSKKDSNDDGFLALKGFSGGKKAKKARGKGKGKDQKIVLAIDTLETFGLLKLTPPKAQSEVQSSIEALVAKKEWFSTLPRGEIESIAEMNQKFEAQNDRDERRGRRDRGDKENKPRSEKKRSGKSAAAPAFDAANEFPDLPSAPKPVAAVQPPKPAEESKATETA